MAEKFDKPLRVVAKRDGFRRCGEAHSVEGRVFKPGHFTTDQVEELKAEPHLVVTEAELEDDEAEDAGSSDDNPTKDPKPKTPTGRGRKPADS